ncbi:MAG: dockerin type I domain-containing protein, partial [Phycisphaerae bacterium]
GGGNDHLLTMDTSTSGNKSGTLTINNNSMSSPVKTVILAGTVSDHAVPSTDPFSQVLSAPLDFGAHPAGQFTNQTATIHNINFDPIFSVPLEVFAATVLNDPQGRFSVPGFIPTAGITTSADFTVAFNDAGAAPGTHTATLEFSTRDDSALPGAMDLPTITFNLAATLPGSLLGDMDGNGVVDMADVPLFVAVLLDPAAATQQDRDTADMNADLANDGLDITPFVTALLP